MKVGIEKTMAVLDDVGNMIDGVAKVVDDGKINIKDVPAAWSILIKAKDLVTNLRYAKDIMAELKDLDEDELAILGNKVVSFVGRLIGK